MVKKISGVCIYDCQILLTSWVVASTVVSPEVEFEGVPFIVRFLLARYAYLLKHDFIRIAGAESLCGL